MKDESKSLIHDLPLFSVNCVDRHCEDTPNRIALIWEKDEPGTQEYVTYM